MSPCWFQCQISPQSLDSWNLALTHSLPKVSELDSSFSVRHVLPISNYHSTIFPHPWLWKAFLYTNKYAVTLKSLKFIFKEVKTSFSLPVIQSLGFKKKKENNTKPPAFFSQSTCSALFSYISQH